MVSSPAKPRIWRRPRFLTYWFASTVSAVDTEISHVAVPLTAVALGANPLQMGMLRASISIFDLLIIGPLAGAWVDRVRRRPLLIATDIGRALPLGLVAIVAALHVLAIEHLLLIALLIGALTTIGKIAERSFLVAVVSRPCLLDASSAVSGGRSVTHVLGPGPGGTLVQLLTAPIAIAVDAPSFAASALGIGLTRAEDARLEPDVPRGSIWAEAAEGLRLVLGHPLLRRILLAAGACILFDSAFFGLYVLHVTNLVTDPITHVCTVEGKQPTVRARSPSRGILGAGEAVYATSYPGADRAD